VKIEDGWHIYTKLKDAGRLDTPAQESLIGIIDASLAFPATFPVSQAEKDYVKTMVERSFRVKVISITFEQSPPKSTREAESKPLPSGGSVMADPIRKIHEASQDPNFGAKIGDMKKLMSEPNLDPNFAAKVQQGVNELEHIARTNPEQFKQFVGDMKKVFEVMMENPPNLDVQTPRSPSEMSFKAVKKGFEWHIYAKIKDAGRPDSPVQYSFIGIVDVSGYFGDTDVVYQSEKNFVEVEVKKMCKVDVANITFDITQVREKGLAPTIERPYLVCSVCHNPFTPGLGKTKRCPICGKVMNNPYFGL